MKRGISRSSLKHRHTDTQPAIPFSLRFAQYRVRQCHLHSPIAFILIPPSRELERIVSKKKKKSVHVQNSIYPALYVCVCVFGRFFFFLSVFYLRSIGGNSKDSIKIFFRFVSSWYLICKCRRGEFLFFKWTYYVRIR